MKPKVSIITATYNSEHGLERALRSALDQDYENIELVVVDGGSRDRTLEIIEKFKPNIGKFVSERDKGIYDALNKGIALATGDVIGFLHSDDQFHTSQSLSHLMACMSQKNADGVYSDLNYISSSGSTTKILRHWQSKEFTKSLLSQGWMPPHPTLYLKREVYQKAGTFDLNFAIAADYDFILRTFSKSELRFAYHPEVTVEMEIGGASNRNLKKIIQKSTEDFQALQKNGFNPFNAAKVLAYKNFSKIPQLFQKGSGS